MISGGSFTQATTVAFLRGYGVAIRDNGQKRWPDEVTAQSVAESLKPGVTVNAVAARYGLQMNHLSEWRGRVRDGKLVLLSLADDGLCFAPLVLLDETTGPVSARPERPDPSETPLLGPIEIAVGLATIRLDGATSATRIAEIVRAIGNSS